MKTEEEKFKNIESITAMDLLKKYSPVISSSCKVIDSYLKGGLRLGINEFVGEAGSGKTNLALQFMIQAQLPEELGGLNGGSALISTQGDVPIRRIKQIEKKFHKKYEWTKEYDFCENIFIHSVHTIEDQCQVLFEKLPTLLAKENIRLIVIDSIASLFRSEVEEFFERSQLFFNVAGHLKYLSGKYLCPIIVVNEVTDFVSKDKPCSINEYLDKWKSWSSGRYVVPSLGFSWANCINSRICFSRNKKFAQTNEDDVSDIRALKKRKSSLGDGKTGINEIEKETDGKQDYVEKIVRYISVNISPVHPCSSSTLCEITINDDGVSGKQISYLDK